MELTGKCRKEFQKCYLGYSTEEDLWNHNNVLTDSEKYGVLVDYFDSAGIDIVDNIDSCANDFRYLSKVDFKFIDAHNTRPEARTASIEKANELRNEVLNK